MDLREYQLHNVTTRTKFTELVKKMGGWEREYCEKDILPYWDKNDWWDYSNTANILMKVSNGGSGEIVAGCAYKTINNKLHIKRLFTSTHWRKQGHAYDLLKHAWRMDFESARFMRMYCDEEAIPFYEKLGFRMMGTNAEGYGYVLQPMLFRDMDFTLNHCKNFELDYLLDEQDKTFISYDFI